MSEAATTTSTTVTVPSLDEIWPDPDRVAGPALLSAAVGVGLLSAVVLPGRPFGLGAFVLVVLVVGIAARSVPAGLDRFQRSAAAVCLALASVLVLRDAEWVVALCLLAAFGLGIAALCRAHTVAGLLGAAVAVPAAWVRGMPWLRRGIAAVGPERPRALWPVARTLVVTVVLALAFGWLFASADAVFAEWTDRLLPEPSLHGLGSRLFAFAVATPLTLAVGYVAAVPPRFDRLARPAGPAVRRFEWAVPVAVVDLLFVVFLAAQLTSMFGGDAYVRRTTGLTYAEYVHQGFGQLVATTMLTLLVVAASARRASRHARTDRLLLRVLLGLLCLLTLVVVGSALHRLYVYEQAYGFTSLRLLAATFELWLGGLVVLLLVAGVALRGRWLPRAAVASGAVVLLALALLNPDAFVADRNVDRFEHTGRIDWVYLSTLSADAAPALDRLPEPYRSCALRGVVPVPDGDVLAWNLGRTRADDVLRARPVDTAASCGSLPLG